MKNFRENLQIIDDLKIIKDSSVFGFSLLLYFIVMGRMTDLLEHLSFGTKEIYTITYIVCAITAIVLFLCIRRSKTYKSRISKFVVRKVNIRKLLSIYSLDFMLKLCCLTIFTIINYLLLNRIGISIIDSTTPSLHNLLDSNPVIYIIIACILGPISEELICRGIGVGILKKYGKTTTIFFVSIIFGLCHGNIAQSACAAIGGIVLTYVYLEYGLAYSIFLHMVNNFLVSIISISGNVIFFKILIFIVYIIGAIILYKKANHIIRYLKKGSFNFRIFIFYVLNPFIIILIIMSIKSIIENIEFI